MNNGQITAAGTGRDDLHCHLLPAWDDGAKNLHESLAMARRACAAGVTSLLVTPHVAKSSPEEGEKPAAEIPAAVAELEARLHDEGIALALVPGAEITLSQADITGRIASEPWLTVAGKGRHALVETPMRSWPPHIDRVLFEISLTGVCPILAHPERIPELQRDPGLARDLSARGVLLQVTARSVVAGRSSESIRACARQMLAAGLVSLVASDAHSANSVFPGEIEALLIELVGAAASHEILVENPRRILNGESAAPPLAIAPAVRESGWGKLRKLVRR